MENTKRGFSSLRDKTSVHYRHAERCLDCDHYRNGRCARVDGGISPNGTCDLWEMRDMPSAGIDGEFYLDEYKKGTVQKSSDGIADFYIDEYNKTKGS